MNIAHPVSPGHACRAVPATVALVVLGLFATATGCGSVVFVESNGGLGGADNASTTSSSTSMGAGAGTAGSTTAGVGGGDPCLPVDDSNPCTDDACFEGIPIHNPIADGTACSDGDLCTQADSCQAGVCAGGSPVVCGGASSCVAGACAGPGCAGLFGDPKPPIWPGAGVTPRFVAAADLNGDGKPELIVTNQSYNLTVLAGKGDGTFKAADEYLVAQDPTVVVAADMNGDGDLDLVVAIAGIDSVGVLVNQGNGTFAAAVEHPAGMDPVSVAAADLNGDGSIDLLVANRAIDMITVLLNDCLP